MKPLLASGLVWIVLALTTGARAQSPDAPRPPNEGREDAGAAEPTSPDGGVDGAQESAPADAQGPLTAGAASAEEPQASPSIAPEAAITAEPPVASGAEEMVVTGSRLKRSKFAASAPVEVVDRAQLERSGATNLADVVQNLTASQGTGSQANVTQGGLATGGVVMVNLRGLGEGATLLLINGRRVNPSGASVDTNITDLSTIPLAAVERIEILKAGASALYGADAVGGVVNIITRRNFSGFRIETDGQTTSRFDHSDFTGSAAFGVSEERLRVLVSGSYMRRSELDAGERDWTKRSYISTQGHPGAFVPATATGMPLAGARPDPACGQVPGSMPAPSGPNTICTFDYRNFQVLIGNHERVNTFSSAEYDLTKHTSVFGEFSASRMRGDLIGLPSQALISSPVIPADHVDNPFVVPDGLPNAGQRTAVLFVGRPLGAAAGATRGPFADDTVRGVLGLRGDFEGVAQGTVFESWEWELYSMMGISRYRYAIKDNLRQPLVDALNSCSDPSDLSRCFNPFYSAVDGTGTPNSTRVIRSFSGEMTIMNDHALQTYNGGMSGSLFALPGGSAGLAFGGEVRHEWRTSDFDHDANEDRYIFFVGNPDTRIDRNVYSGYLELRLPFFRGLEVQGAARLEHYTDIASTSVSPFAGLSLAPAQLFGPEKVSPLLRTLQLRGNVSTAFRAPTIVQSDASFQTVPYPLRLSASSPLATYLPIRRFGNPDLKPETALTLSAGLSWSPIDALAVFADFWRYDYKNRISIEDAQQAVNQDMVNRDPRVVRDSNDSIVGVNVRQINLKGNTVTSGIDFGVMLNFPGASRPKDSWNLSVGALGTYTFIYDIPRTAASPRSIPGDPATGAAAKVLAPADCEGSSDVVSVNAKDVCHLAGKRNANNFAPPIPRWRVNFPITFSVAGHSASAITHFISGMEDDVLPNLDGSFDWISPWLSLDLQYGYVFKDVIGDELALRVGVYNLFDADPPHVNGSTAAYEVAIHDPRGRMYYAKLSGRF